MADIPIPLVSPLTPNRVGIYLLTVRTADGVKDRATVGGDVLPAGTVYVSIVPAEWADDVFIRVLPAVVVPDVAAWLASLESPELAAEAATRFSRVMGDLLYLTRVQLALTTGVTTLPTAGG